MSIKIDLDEIVNGKDRQTNFTTQLLKLILKADVRNTELLRVSYPNAVMTVRQWQATGEILDLEQD